MRSLRLIGTFAAFVLLLGVLSACAAPATPTASPKVAPTAAPTAAPAPTSAPTKAPTAPAAAPSASPLSSPLPAPAATKAPTAAVPTTAPAAAPSAVAPAAATGKKFIIASDATFPPMEMVDDNKQLVGFDIDLITAIAKNQGFTFEIKNTAFDGILAGLDSGGYDAVLSSVTINEDRQKSYNFSDPYMNAGQAVVVKAAETAIKSDKELVGKTVGAQIGTTGAFAIQKIQNAKLKEYDTIDLALLDLLNGNVQAVVVDTPVAADYALNSAQFKGKLKIVGQPFTDEYYGAVVKKSDPKGFLPFFNAGLKAVKASGEYDKLYAKWIGVAAPK
jgi:polar amino acid transport system substrate-binding protein